MPWDAETKRAWERAYYKTHREQARLKHLKYQAKIKREVLAHYSNGSCVCAMCLEARLPCLSLDHIYGGGNIERRQLGSKAVGSNFYFWLRRNNYPKGYQVLCMNCQTLKKHQNEEFGGINIQK